MRPVAIGLGLILLVIACGIIKNPNTWEGTGEPTVCDYKVAIIYRGQFRTEEDFNSSVTAQIEWLWKHDFIPFNLKYEYNFNMRRTLILRCAVISYKKIRDGQNKAS